MTIKINNRTETNKQRQHEPIRILESIALAGNSYQDIEFKMVHLVFHYDEMGSIPKGSPPRRYCQKIMMPSYTFSGNLLKNGGYIWSVTNHLDYQKSINVCSPYNRTIFDAIANVIYNDTL